MPGRSPPPVMTRRSSPSRTRIIRSSERHDMEIASSSRGRERREYRPVDRRSRSPIPPPKGRPYSPQIKRKATSPIREREMSRRTKISKSPVDLRSSERVSTYTRDADADNQTRPSTSSDRYRNDTEFEPKGKPAFRGPEGSVPFDIHELKKFTVEIIRRPSAVEDGNSINRSIVKPEEIVPVRRPDLHKYEEKYYHADHGEGMRGKGFQKRQLNNHQAEPNWTEYEDESYNFNGNFKVKHEGERPLFMRAQQSTSKERNMPPEDYRRIVAINPSRGSGNVGEHSRERSRYSPDQYEVTRRPVYSERERERSPYESRLRLRTPPREEFIESRERPRERRAETRDDLRREVDVRKREERRYSPDMRSSYERESDLRARINEKRSDNPRVELREHVSGRYESEREKHSRPHRTPPPPLRPTSPRERRRGSSLERHEPSRSRVEYEREKERDSLKRRPHSREREEKGRDRYEHSSHYEERRPHSYKTDYEPKKFYKTYEPREFIPPPPRGRGLPIRRGMPPMMRGRGMIRGMNRGGFRGGPMGGVPRGMPRGPFMGLPRFPPRKSTYY